MNNKLTTQIRNSKSTIIWLISIMILALTVRVTLIQLAPRIMPYYGMSIPMGEAARNMVEGRGYVIDREYVTNIIELNSIPNKYVDIQDVTPPEDEKFEPYYGMPPGTSSLMALTYILSGEYRFIGVRILQSFIDALGCLIIYLLGRELFNRKTGFIAAFLYAVWLPIAYLSTWPLHDAIIPFFALLCLFLFVKGVKQNSIKYFILTGLVCGISCYFQPSLQLLPIIFGAGVFIYSLHKKDIWKQLLNTLKVTVIMLVVTILVMSPWMVRNSMIWGAPSGMRPGLWSGLWEMMGEFGENPAGAVLSDGVALQFARKQLGYDVEYGSPEFDAVFKPVVIKAITENPGWYISLIFKRIPRAVFNFSELGINLHPFIYSSCAEWFKYLYGNAQIVGYLGAINTMMIGLRDGSFWSMLISQTVGAIYLGLVWVFALIPPLVSMLVFIFKRKDWRNLALVATVPVYIIIVHIFTMVASYKSIVPESIGYILFCAVAICGLWDWLGRQSKKTERVNIKSDFKHDLT